MARKKTFPCGHKGLGKDCHRCEQSGIFLAASEDAKKYKMFFPMAKVPFEEAKATLKAEAARLKEVPKKISAGMPTAPSPA